MWLIFLMRIYGETVWCKKVGYVKVEHLLLKGLRGGSNINTLSGVAEFKVFERRITVA